MLYKKKRENDIFEVKYLDNLNYQKILMKNQVMDNALFAN